MQLTQLKRTANQREAGQSSRVELRWRRYRHFADATQLNSTSSWIELCRYKRALRVEFVLKNSPSLYRKPTSLGPNGGRHWSSHILRAVDIPTTVALVFQLHATVQPLSLLVSRRSRQRERLSALGLSICLFVSLLVCLSVAKMQKTLFSQS